MIKKIIYCCDSCGKELDNISTIPIELESFCDYGVGKIECHVCKYEKKCLLDFFDKHWNRKIRKIYMRQKE